LLIAGAQARKLSARYLDDLQHRVGKFAKAFQVPSASVTAEEVREFISDMELSPRSQNNYLGAVNRVFEFAKARKLLPADHDELSGLEPVKDKGGEIEIYSSPDLDRLLTAADDDILPAFVIGAFAGLRSAEIERLDWSEVNLEEKFITVTAGKAKTAARRVVPITDNLAASLEPAEKSGEVWELGHAYFHQRLRETAAATGSESVKAVQLKSDALRHSFISYRVAHTQNVNQVALEAGNSPSMIVQHYRELVTKKQAELWFSIVPSGDEAMPQVAVKA
jgi:integrase